MCVSVTMFHLSVFHLSSLFPRVLQRLRSDNCILTAAQGRLGDRQIHCLAICSGRWDDIREERISYGFWIVEELHMSSVIILLLSTTEFIVFLQSPIVREKQFFKG